VGMAAGAASVVSDGKAVGASGGERSAWELAGWDLARNDTLETNVATLVDDESPCREQAPYYSEGVSFGPDLDEEDEGSPAVRPACAKPLMPRGRGISFFPPGLSEWNPSPRPRMAGAELTAGSSRTPARASTSSPHTLPPASRPGTRTSFSGSMTDRPATRNYWKPEAMMDRCTSSATSRRTDLSPEPDVDDGLIRVFVRLPGSGRIAIRVDPCTRVGPSTRVKLNRFEELWGAAAADVPGMSSSLLGDGSEAFASVSAFFAVDSPSLKELIEVVSGVPVSAQKVVLRVFGPLDNDDRRLHEFGFRDGTHVALSIKPGCVLAREGERGHRFLASPGLVHDRAPGHSNRLMGQAAAVAYAIDGVVGRSPEAFASPSLRSHSMLGGVASSRCQSSLGGVGFTDLPSEATPRRTTKMVEPIPCFNLGRSSGPPSFVHGHQASDRNVGAWRGASSRMAALASHATRGRLRPKEQADTVAASTAPQRPSMASY